MSRKIKIGIFGILIVTALVLAFFVVYGGTKKPAKPRKLSLPALMIGNWMVKNPPKPAVDPKMPKGYVPPPPNYNLTFTVEGNFSMNLDGKSFQGTYIISGTTIQLIPTGKNYVFEMGPTEKEDRIIGEENLMWVRVGSFTPPSVTPTPTPTPVTPTIPNPNQGPPVTPEPVPRPAPQPNTPQAPGPAVTPDSPPR
jgi:hypothetical protein